MHEFSICEDLITAILEELDKVDCRGRVTLLKARVVVGKLRQVVPDNLAFAYEVLGKEAGISGSKLEIVERPITAKCKECGWQGEIRDSLFMCARCESMNIEQLSGSELYLENLEVSTDEQ